MSIILPLRSELRSPSIYYKYVVAQTTRTRRGGADFPGEIDTMEGTTERIIRDGYHSAHEVPHRTHEILPGRRGNR